MILGTVSFKLQEQTCVSQSAKFYIVLDLIFLMMTSEINTIPFLMIKSSHSV